MKFYISLRHMFHMEFIQQSSTLVDGRIDLFQYEHLQSMHRSEPGRNWLGRSETVGNRVKKRGESSACAYNKQQKQEEKERKNYPSKKNEAKEVKCSYICC